jgi:hypothetical protein
MNIKQVDLPPQRAFPPPRLTQLLAASWLLAVQLT